MPTASFFKMTKRRNSTLTPAAGTPILAGNIIINDSNTSILTPTIRIAPGNNSALLGCNYVFINDFNRYYYISDWHYNADGTWSAECNVDYLASHKTAIWNSRGYVGRASGTHDANVIDGMYPAKTNFRVKHETGSTGLTSDISSGSFVLGIISADAPNIGAVSYYRLTATELATLVQKLVGVGTQAGSVDFSTVDSITGDVLKSLVNPFQFIVSCKWFPISPSYISQGTTPSSNIKVYNWDSGITPLKLSQTYVSLEGHMLPLKINEHVDGGQIVIDNTIDMDLYPQTTPYTSYNFISPWGTYELDPSVMREVMTKLQNFRDIKYTLKTNLISGTATLLVSTDALQTAGTILQNRYYEFFRKEVDLAVDIPLSQVSFDYVSVAKSGISAVGAAGNIGAWITNPVGNAAEVASSTIDAIAGALSPAAQSSGAAAAAITPDIETVALQTVCYETFGQSRRMFGRPLKQEVTHLSDTIRSETEGEGDDAITYTYNYVQVDVSEFASADCLDAERDAIINLLKEGVFLE